MLGLFFGVGALSQVAVWSQTPPPVPPPGGGAQPVVAVKAQPTTASLSQPAAAPVQQPVAVSPQGVPAQPVVAPEPAPTPLPEKAFPARVDKGAERPTARENCRNDAKSASSSASGESGDKSQAASEEDVKIRLNFRGADLDTVLSYLSEAAGFIISREVDVKGKIDVWSAITDQSRRGIRMINTVLNVKGYATSRNGRILRIVKRDDAKFENLPIHIGSDPDQIPESEEIVTQIIPIRGTDATKLTQTLQPLLPDYSIMIANAGSNTIILTDTQLNIRRMCKIIKALDSTISSILEVKLYPLKNADATEVAKLIKEIFQPPTASGGEGGGREGGRRGGGPAEFFMRMGGMGGGQQGDNSSSEARSAASKIVAMADTRTNSVIVNAAAELHEPIQALIDKLDTMAENLTDLRVFPLQYADAETLARTLSSLFSASNTTSNQNQQRGGFGGRMMPPFMRGFEQNNSGDKSERALKEAQVTIVAEAQTNSLIVSASENSMSAVETLIRKFDTQPDGVTDIRIYKLLYSDSEELATTLSNLFQARTSGSTSTRGNMMGGFGGRGGMFGGGMFGNTQNANKSDRQKLTEQVTVVAETQTNSLIVEASEDSFPLIEKLIRQFDTKSDELTETQLFPLKYADATELADTLMNVFYDQMSGSSGYGNRSSAYGGRNSTTRRSSYGGMGSSSSSTRRGTLEQTVIIVADERTNSVIATALGRYHEGNCRMVEKLDSNSARDQKVFVYRPGTPMRRRADDYPEHVPFFFVILEQPFDQSFLDESKLQQYKQQPQQYEQP
jgi:type II secretory pathway component GspD/PulD (secretin)